MIVFRTSFPRPIVPLFGLAIVLVAGCATATKPTPDVSAKNAATPPTEAPISSAPAPIAPSSVPLPSGVSAPAAQAASNPPAAVAMRATIKGSQEASILLDNFTVFVASIDGRKIPAGRNGWDTPLWIDVGHRVIEAEFNRGVFMARTKLTLAAKAQAHYALKYATDAELFGHNSYCNFWIVDLATGQAVTAVEKASVEKIAVAADRSILP